MDKEMKNIVPTGYDVLLMLSTPLSLHLSIPGIPFVHISEYKL